jgi:hypothetical protein
MPASTIVAPAPAPLIATLSVMSRSPVAMSFWLIGGIAIAYVPEGTSITSAPGRALASWIAARSVQEPVRVAQLPSPGRASTASLVLPTTNSAGLAAAASRPTVAAIARAIPAAAMRAFTVMGFPMGGESALHMRCT